MAKRNSSSRARSNSKSSSRPKKEEKVKVEASIEATPETASKFKQAGSVIMSGTGKIIQFTAKSGMMWGIGGLIVMYASSYLGLGLLGVLGVLAGAYLLVEALKFGFSNEEKYVTARGNAKNTVDATSTKIRNGISPQAQAA